MSHPVIRLTADVLAREDFAVAARSHDFGMLFHVIRKWAGVSFAQIAAASTLKPERVGAMVRGSGRITSYEKIAAVSDGLGIPGHMLGLAPRPWERFEEAPTDDVLVIPTRDPDGRICWLAVGRGALMSHAAQVSVTLGAYVGSLLDTRSTLVDPPSPAEQRKCLHDLRRILVEIDNLLGPGNIIATSHEYLALSRELAQGATGDDARFLTRAQAEWAEFTSWLYHDTGDFNSARYWLHRASRLAKVAADAELVSYIQARRSQLASDLGDGTAATYYGQAALRGSPDRIEVAASTYLAHGAVLCGRDAESALANLDRVNSILECDDQGETPTASDDSGAGSEKSVLAQWADVAYVAVARGRCMAVMGHYDAADAAYQQGLDQLAGAYRRDRGVYLARQACVQAQAGNPDQAVDTGMDALRLAHETGSGRIRRELDGLRDALAPWRDHPVVSDCRAALEGMRFAVS
jgi:hypothetical protein